MGIPGFGTLFQTGDGAPTEAFTTVAEVREIGGPNMSRDAIDVTNHSSPGAWRQFISGLKDAGEIPLDLNFLPADATHDQSTGLLSLFVSGEQNNFRLILPDAVTTQLAFAGIVTGFEIVPSLEDRLQANVTIKVTGAVTIS